MVMLLTSIGLRPGSLYCMGKIQSVTDSMMGGHLGSRPADAHRGTFLQDQTPYNLTFNTALVGETAF